MKDFEIKTKDIFYHIAEFGIRNMPLDYKDIGKLSKKDIEEFLILVHKGFRLGQNLIIAEIVPLLEQNKNLKEKEKEAKKIRDKDLIEKTSVEINLNEHKIKILRHFADFIAWQILKKDYYKARRFYSGNSSRPDLLNSNLKSVLKAVEHFHNQDDKNFALISDLTTFIDIGDILLLSDKGMTVIECKEGEVQKKVFDFLDEVSKKDFLIKNIDYSDKNEKFFQQAQRTLKQIEKGDKLIDFLKNEGGTDPFSETKIKVLEATNRQENYFEYLMELIEESKVNSSTYGEVEGIIYIGIYRDKKIPIGSFLFKEIVNHIYEKHIVLDYLNIIGLPLKEPLFLKPLGTETIFDLLFGRIKIYLAINLDKLIELFNKKGIEAKWLSRKETHKLLGPDKKFHPFIYKNMAIQIVVDEEQIVLGDSFLIYLLLDNISPNSFVGRYNNIKKGKP